MNNLAGSFDSCLIAGNRYSKATVASVTLVAAAMVSGMGGAPSARASVSHAINGTYRATSVGTWAKLNNSFHDEPIVASTWTVTSSCSDAQECTGHVTSDQGWDAPMVMHDGTMWFVRREVPNWGTCPDGSTYTGKQTFLFVPVTPDGLQGPDWSPTLTGKDMTLGPGGACRVNKVLAIEMPFRLDKIG